MEALLAVECDVEILSYRTREGHLLWPLVRNSVLSWALYELQGIENPWKDLGRASVRALSAYLPAVARSTLRLHRARRRTADIVIFTGSTSCVWRNGAYVNRLSDPFGQLLLDRTVVLERSSAFRVRRPRVFPHVEVSDPLFLPGQIARRFARPSVEDVRLAEGLVGFLRAELPMRFRSSDFWNRLLRRAAGAAATAHLQSSVFRTFLERYRPSLLLVEDACYGGPLALLVRTARSLGIRVAEYQHGLISREHQAYNYGRAIFSSEYEAYLPEALLSYGAYWAAIPTLPCKKVVIGNPWLSEGVALARAQGPTERSRRSVLVTSASHEPARLCRLVLDLLRSLPTAEIRFRPHPGEAAVASRRYEALTRAGVTLDVSPLYESLSKASHVVGEISTALFEALAFDIPVFCLSGRIAEDNNIGSLLPSVADAADFVRKTERAASGAVAEDRVRSDELWAPDWEQRYLAFVSEALAEPLSWSDRAK